MTASAFFATPAVAEHPYPSAAISSDLVEVKAVPAVFLGNNGFSITDVSNRSARTFDIPAGTRFILKTNGIGNVAVGSYPGYNLSLLGINTSDYLVTLTTALNPSESRFISLGNVQVTLLTTYTLSLDSYDTQPSQTKTVLDQTELANPADSQYLYNNSAGLNCVAAIAPLASLCSATA
ncbi:hypothetical protein [Nocardia brasiliensis]|uniref:hypothetical protein n=1 Tax=Nocardia brasiliensis TaxID=37326 RepID=UPI003D90EBC4